MPALGMAQDTGRLVRWLAPLGAALHVGDPLMEVETDKATVTIDAAATGVLLGVTAEAGAVVPVGTVLGWIGQPSEMVPELPVHRATDRPARVSVPAPREPSAGVHPDARSEGGAGGEAVAASPRARQLAREMGVSLRDLVGSGPGGAVLAADVPGEGSAPGWPAPACRRVRMAENLSRVWATTPHIFLRRDLVADRLVGWQDSLRAGGVRATLTDLFLWAIQVALGEDGTPSATWAEDHVQARALRRVGLAVATDHGLLVVALPELTNLTMAELVRLRRAAVGRARENHLTADDLSQAVVTLTNLGMYGVDSFDPVLPAGQSAIVAVGGLQERVVAHSGELRIAPVLSLTLGVDHRVLDGVQAARFLNRLVDVLEAPTGTANG